MMRTMLVAQGVVSHWRSTGKERAASCYPIAVTKVASTGMLAKASTVVTKVPWAMTRELPPYW